MTEHLRDAQLWQQHNKVLAANVSVERIAKGLTAAKHCLRVAQQRQLQAFVGRCIKAQQATPILNWRACSALLQKYQIEV